VFLCGKEIFERGQTKTYFIFKIKKKKKKRLCAKALY